ncbi:MAG: hypothetical protein ACTHU0_21230 [Kofleriaceae bacterium]
MAGVRREHRPVAIALSIYLCGSVATALLRKVAPVRLAMTAPPLEGVQLLARHADRVLVLGTPVILAWMSLRVFRRLPGWPVWVFAAAATLALVLGYPDLRFAALAAFYFVAEVAAAGVCLVALFFWWYRRPRQQPPSPTVVIAAVLALAQPLHLVVGTYGADVFTTGWDLSRAVFLVALLMVCVLQLRFLLRVEGSETQG